MPGKEGPATPTRAPGGFRPIPCLPCIRSGLSGSSDGGCQDYQSQHSHHRCLRCANNNQSCSEAPERVGSLGARLSAVLRLSQTRETKREAKQLRAVIRFELKEAGEDEAPGEVVEERSAKEKLIKDISQVMAAAGKEIGTLLADFMAGSEE